MANGKKTLDIQTFIRQIKDENCFYVKAEDDRKPYYGKIVFHFLHGNIVNIEKTESIK